MWHVPVVFRQIFATLDTLAGAVGVEALLMGAGVPGRVGQTLHAAHVQGRLLKKLFTICFTLFLLKLSETTLSSNSSTLERYASIFAPEKSFVSLTNDPSIKLNGWVLR